MESGFYGAILAFIGVMLGILINPIFTRKNNEQNSLHSESVWREKLFKLSCSTYICSEKLELFRTFLSATRGMGDLNNNMNYPIDVRVNGRKQDLDDTCLHYYHFLKSKLYNNLSISREEIEIFNQLCRCLLKSDWDQRIQGANISNLLKCVDRYEEMELKAVSITKNKLDSTNFDEKYKKYQDTIKLIINGKKNVKDINFQKAFLILIASFFILFLLCNIEYFINIECNVYQTIQLILLCVLPLPIYCSFFLMLEDKGKYKIKIKFIAYFFIYTSQLFLNTSIIYSLIYKHVCVTITLSLLTLLFTDFISTIIKKIIDKH